MEEIKHEITRKRTRIDTKLLVFLFCFSFVLLRIAMAADFYLSPNSNSYSVGQTFSVTVYVSSPQQALNAVSGIISFPADKLQVTGLSKSGSLISTWVEEPSFDNNSGTINFEGVIFNPGYQGREGKILTINFKTKSSGTASLVFSSGSILANDGQGTNIIDGLGSAQFVIKSTPLTEPLTGETTTSIPKSGTPPGIKIQSPTHPDPTKWYQNSSPKFTWNLSEDISKIAFTLDQKPSTVPAKTSEQLVTSYQAQDLKEGVWYFHLQAKNASGWGDVSHFKVQIDKTPPESFTIKVDNKGDKTNPRPYLIFETKDALSGIDHYEIQVNELPIVKVFPSEIQNNSYQLSVTPPNTYKLLIKAIDKAGNFTIATESFTIEPIASPVISEYSKTIKLNEPIVLKGTAFTRGVIEISIQNEVKETFTEKITTDEDGNWHYISSKLFKKGIYSVSAVLIDERGARSNPSEVVQITASEPQFIQIGNVLISYLSIIINLVALILLLVIIILYGIRKIKRLEKIKKIDFTQEEKELFQIFTYIKQEVSRQIAYLDGQPYLSESEARILENLNQILDFAQQGIKNILKKRQQQK